MPGAGNLGAAVQRAASGTGTATALCLENETATGGGFVRTSGSGAVNASRPVVSSGGVPIGWQAEMVGAGAQVTAYVVCVPR